MHDERSNKEVLSRIKKSDEVCELDNIVLRDHLICRVCTILVGKEHYVKELYNDICADCVRRGKI